jgi:predicted RNA-binding Zn-ribbon protein involved in translation (DUF1610 family)
MMDVLMREVYCPNCGDPTRIQASILAEIFERQSAIHDDERYINYACPYCNLLTHARVEPEGRIYSEVDLRKFPVDLTHYIVPLRCAKTGCESRVILLAPVKRGTGEEQWWNEAQTNWRNHSAVCAENHPPFYPLQFEPWLKLPQ